jgi:hypothetical protein
LLLATYPHRPPPDNAIRGQPVDEGQ